MEAEHHAAEALRAARGYRSRTYDRMIAAMRQKEDPG